MAPTTRSKSNIVAAADAATELVAIAADVVAFHLLQLNDVLNELRSNTTMLVTSGHALAHMFERITKGTEELKNIQEEHMTLWLQGDLFVDLDTVDPKQDYLWQWWPAAEAWRRVNITQWRMHREEIAEEYGYALSRASSGPAGALTVLSGGACSVVATAEAIKVDLQGSDAVDRGRREWMDAVQEIGREIMKIADDMAKTIDKANSLITGVARAQDV